MELPSNIAAYREAAKEIASWMPNWISQHKFDDLAWRLGPLSRKALWLDDETEWLGELGGRKKELDLLLRLVVCGVIEQKKLGGVFYYRAISDERARRRRGA